MKKTKGKGQKGKLAVKREAVKSLTDEELDQVSGGMNLPMPLPSPMLKGATVFGCGEVAPLPFPLPGGGISRPTGNPTGSDGCCGG